MSVNKSPRVVVITGASGGIGRASARMFAQQGDHVALLARGSTGLGRGRPRGPRPRRRRLADQRRHRRPPGARAGRGPGRGRARPDRRVGQRRVHLGVRPLHRHRTRRVPPRHRGHLPRLRQRHPHRPDPDAAPRPRRDRPGRVRARPPRHPAAVGLLRRQARHVGVPRVAADRAAPRPQQRARHLGGDARGQHPPVHVGAVQAARRRPNRSRPSTSPRSPPAASCTPPRTPNDAPTGSARHRRHHHRQPGRRRAPGPLPGAHRGGLPADPRHPTRRTSRPTCGSPPTAPDGHDYGAHGPFDDRALAHSPQQWASQHRRALGLAALGVAGGAALRSRRTA